MIPSLKLTAKKFTDLTTSELYEIMRARNEIFVIEQQCIYQDCDDCDQGYHVFYSDEDGRVRAYMRIYEIEEATEIVSFEGQMIWAGNLTPEQRSLAKPVPGAADPVQPGAARTVQMGRVLTLEHGRGLGRRLLSEGVRIAGEKMHADRIFIEAESDVALFYAKAGFSQISGEFMKDGIPHIQMERWLDQPEADLPDADRKSGKRQDSPEHPGSGAADHADRANRLRQQMDFCREIDQEKEVFRQTFLCSGNRRENDAEHAWHMALMAVILREYSNEEIDLLRVITMLLIHDIVEIDAGDTYAYDVKGIESQKDREEKAAQRIFGLLPEDQRIYMLDLFHEFEEAVTPEARFAKALDNVQPVMLNDASGGRDWREKGIRLSQAIGRQRRTARGSRILWEQVSRPMIQRNIDKGNIIGDISLEAIDE